MLEFDLHGKKSKVALLAIDKAFYALHADNKLTAKQVTIHGHSTRTGGNSQPFLL